MPSPCALGSLGQLRSANAERLAQLSSPHDRRTVRARPGTSDFPPMPPSRDGRGGAGHQRARTAPKDFAASFATTKGWATGSVLNSPRARAHRVAPMTAPGSSRGQPGTWPRISANGGPRGHGYSMKYRRAENRPATDRPMDSEEEQQTRERPRHVPAPPPKMDPTGTQQTQAITRKQSEDEWFVNPVLEEEERMQMHELLAQGQKEAAKEEVKKSKKIKKLKKKLARAGGSADSDDTMRSSDGMNDGGSRSWRLGAMSSGGNLADTGMAGRLPTCGLGGSGSRDWSEGQVRVAPEPGAARPGSAEAHLQGAPLLLPIEPQSGSVPAAAAAAPAPGAFQLEKGSKWRVVQRSEQMRALNDAEVPNSKWDALVKPWMAKYDMAARVYPGSIEERLEAAKKESSEMLQKEKARLTALDKRAHHMLDEVQFLVTRKVNMTRTSARIQKEYSKMNHFIGGKYTHPRAHPTSISRDHF